MNFVRSKFGTNEPLPVEHTANQQKSEEKSVQLAEVHLYRIYFLQNPYFSVLGIYITLRVGCCLRENATIIFIKTTWWRLRTLNNELWISLLWNLMRHSWASFPRHLLAKKAKPFHTSVSNSNYPNLFLSLPTLTYYGCCCLHTKHRLRKSGMTFFHEKIGIIYRLKQIHIAVSLS